MAIRLRSDFIVVLKGETFKGSTTFKDQLEFKKQVKNPNGDAEDMARITWIALKRLEKFSGTFDEFCDQLEDAEWTVGDDLPPLSEAPSKKRSQQ